MTTFEALIIEESDDGQRLDRWLKKNYPQIPFGQMQKILRTGQIRVDGKRVKGEHRLATGQSLRIPPQLVLPPKKGETGLSEKDEAFIQSLVIYQDDYIIAINKPPGLATQGGSKIARHVDGLLDGLRFDGEKPHLVHRLDKDTSGVLLLARGPKMARALGDVFQSREIRKYYWAVTTPSPMEHEGKVRSSLAKVAGRGGERMMAVNEDDGKMALTYFSVLENLQQVGLVAFWPRTGRTHQIRVHASQIGCPLVGDYKYGYDPEVLAGHQLPDALHLHARRLIFEHPATGDTVDIIAPIPAHMQKTFKHFAFEPDDRSDPFEDVE